MQDQMQTSRSTQKPSAAGKLLEPKERDVLEKVAAGETQSSQWARALSAIDVGATQVEAAQESGLTSGQVKYLLAKFRKQRLDIFPEQELSPAYEDPLPFAPTAPAEDAPALGTSSKPELEAELQTAPVKGKAVKAGSKKEKGKREAEKSGRKKGKKARKKDARKNKSAKKDMPSKKSKKDKNAGDKPKKRKSAGDRPGGKSKKKGKR